MSTRAARDRAVALAREIGLGDRVDQKIGAFSKGMRQRVALARALVHDPPALFLDEPTSGLDVEAAIEFRERIKEFRHERRSIVLCTHILTEAEELADQVVVIQRGHIVAQGTPSELKRSARGERFRVVLAKPLARYAELFDGLTVADVESSNGTISFRTQDPAKTNPEIVRRLVAAKAQVVALEELDRSLEDAYLDIVKGARGEA